MGRPSYHLSPPSGWMNDPNGFSFFGGRYHLFYQHYPKAPRWGRMSWGHAASDDLVGWEHLPVALKPDTFWDGALGCFSGSAIERAGELKLLYTGVSALGQYQLLARSTDGLRFTKHPRPVIGPGNLPPGGGALAFRDPKVFERDGRYYCVVGSSWRDNGRRGALIGARRGDLPSADAARRRPAAGAQISLYRSDDLETWTCVGALARDAFPRGGIFECPDCANVDGKDILIASPMYLPKNGEDEFENLHSAVFILGNLDAEGGAFLPDDGPGVYRELDGGTDFYAPQTMVAPDGRVIMVAWMQMWKRSMPTAKDGWAGAMTFPRELSYRNGELIQWPVKEIERYWTEATTVRDLKVDGVITHPGVSGSVCDIELEVELGSASVFGLRLFAPPGSKDTAVGPYAAPVGPCLALEYRRDTGAIVLDRSRSPEPIASKDRAEAQCHTRITRVKLRDGALRLRLLLDRGSLEAFVDGGCKVLSTVYYAPSDHTGIAMYSVGPARVVSLSRREIEIAGR